VLLIVIIEGAVLTKMGLRCGGVLPYDSRGSNIISFAAIEGTTLGLCSIRTRGETADSGYVHDFQLIDLTTGHPVKNPPSGFVNLEELKTFHDDLGNPMIEWMHGTRQPERVLVSKFPERHHCLPRPRLMYCESLGTILEYDSAIIAWSVDRMQQVWTTDIDAGAMQCVVPLVGSTFCGFDSGQIVELDSATGRIIKVIHSCFPALSRLAASPCGTYLAIVTVDGRLVLRDVRNDETLWTQAGTNGIFTPHFLSNGQSIVILQPRDRYRLSVVDVASGRIVQHLGTHRGVLGAASDQQRDQIYTWGLDGKLIAWDLTDGTVKWKFDAGESHAWF
jgi:hypothetical protein